MTENCHGEYYPALGLYRCTAKAVSAWVATGEAAPEQCSGCGRKAEPVVLDETPVRTVRQVQHPHYGWLDLPVPEDRNKRAYEALEAAADVAETAGHGNLASVLTAVSLLWMMGQEQEAKEVLDVILGTSLGPATLENPLPAERI